MESFFTRYRNATILVAVLFAQVLGLAVQVRRPAEGRSVRLVRVWAVAMITPLEKAVVNSQRFTGDFWRNYVWLRGLRTQNAELRGEVERMRLEQVRLSQDAAQAHRLQALLGFKEQFVSQTVAAQVIGSSGSEQSRTIYIDKGAADGLRPDMPVITPDGIVGKVLKTFAPGLPHVAQVLLINDASSGVGAILNKSRLQGILKGTPAGEIVLHYVMSDEKVEPGEPVLTSGGDRIFPKGLPVGTVAQVSTAPDLFLNIRVKPAAQISRLEEVLVITRIDEKPPQPGEMAAPVRAADILAERLPTLPKPADPKAAGASGVATSAAAAPVTSSAAAPKPGNAPAATKPASTNGAGAAATRPPAAANANSAAAPKKASPKPSPKTPASTGPPPSASNPQPTPESGPSATEAKPPQSKPEPSKPEPPRQEAPPSNAVPPPEEPAR